MQRKTLSVRNFVSLHAGLFSYIIFLLIFFSLFIGCSNRDSKPENKITGTDLEIGKALMLRSSTDSALIFFNRSADEALARKDMDTWFRSIAEIIDCYRAKGEFEKAFGIVNEARSVAVKNSDTTGEIYAGILHKKALILSDKRDFDASTALLRKSIALRSSIAPRSDTAIGLSYNIIGNNYLFRGDYNKALENYLKARSGFDSRNNSVDLATIDQNTGIVYALKGDFDNANKFFHEALAVNQAIISPDDPKLALVYLNYGRYYSLIGNDREALDMYNKAEPIYRKNADDNKKNLAPLYHNMGNIYANSADFDKALLYFNKALSLYQSMPGESEQNIPAILSNIGFIYEKKGNYHQALDNYLQSVEKGKNTLNKVTIYRNLANIYYLTNDFTDARLYYRLALDESLESFGELHPETAWTYLKFGEFLSLNGNSSEALTYLNKSLQIFQKVFGDKNPNIATVLKYIANHYQRNDDDKNALVYFQKSLIAAFNSFNSEDYFDNPVVAKNEMNYFILNSLSGKALSLKKLYQVNKKHPDYLKASADAYDVSIKLIEMLRSSYQNEESKLMIADNEKSTFRNAIEVSVELYNLTNDQKYLEKALELSEKGRSAVLLANIRNLEARQVGKIPDNMREKENSLKEEIGLYDKLVYEEKIKPNADNGKLTLWNNKLFELNNRYDSLITYFEREYPAYYKMKYDNSVMGIHQIQNKLDKGQVVIEYAMNDTLFLYAFIITHSNVTLETIPLSSVFFKDIHTLTEQLSGKSFINYTRADYDLFIEASRRLYKILIPENLKRQTPEELIIIPDGELGYLSFDVLLTEEPSADNTGYRNLPYLIRKCAVNYAPSATMMFGEFNANKQGSREAVAFAPSYENMKGVPVSSILSRQSANSFLLPIPGAQDEVNNLKKIFRCRVISDAEATKENFKKYAGSYSVLHLAMHTLIDDDNPLYSKLVFYRNKPSGEDNLLNTYELFSMQLDAQLAVLSACNTGKGKLFSGEGILSLSRGFFYAGVPSVIMTLWAVEDRSGADLMTSFYKYLKEGKTKNEALRLAKIDYLQSSDQVRAHPHFWAAYLSIGNTKPLVGVAKPIPLTYYIIGSGAVILLLITVILIHRRRRARR